MLQFLYGITASLLINLLTVAGWYVAGPWIPSVINVLLALLILGYYGLEDRWAFPLGYWTVQVVAVAAWISGLGALTTIQF